MTKLTPRFRIVLNELRFAAAFHSEPDDEFFHRFLRKRPSAEVSDIVEKRIADLRDYASQLIHPHAVYGIFPRDHFQIPVFQDADYLALGLVTIGRELEHTAEELSEAGNLADSVILDAWGSAMVEGAVKALDEVIRLEARLLNCIASKRKSPGYKPWSIEEQPFVLNRLKAEKLGVSVTDSYTMVPRKSVSFAIGLNLNN